MFYVKSMRFTEWNGEIRCETEKLLPKECCFAEVEGGKIFGKTAEIGKDEHPFILLCEAAIYVEGAWIVGVDEKTDRYFTPIFTD